MNYAALELLLHTYILHALQTDGTVFTELNYLQVCISAQADKIFIVFLQTLWILDYPQSTLQRLWPSLAKVQADLSSLSAHTFL